MSCDYIWFFATDYQCSHFIWSNATTMQLLTYSSFHLDNFWDCFHPKICSYVPLVASICHIHSPLMYNKGYYNYIWDTFLHIIRVALRVYLKRLLGLHYTLKVLSIVGLVVKFCHLAILLFKKKKNFCFLLIFSTTFSPFFVLDTTNLLWHLCSMTKQMITMWDVMEYI